MMKNSAEDVSTDTESGTAGIKCSDVLYENENYHENMDQLAKLARLPENYWNRYHEDVVSNLCKEKGDTEGIKGMIDNGYVTASEVESIMEVLGIGNRSDTGKSYGFSRKKFEEMGLCSACADNVAQYYTKEPNSRYGKLAKQALEGNPSAVKELQSFPSFCQWKY